MPLSPSFCKPLTSRRSRRPTSAASRSGAGPWRGAKHCGLPWMRRILVCAEPSPYFTAPYQSNPGQIFKTAKNRVSHCFLSTFKMAPGIRSAAQSNPSQIFKTTKNRVSYCFLSTFKIAPGIRSAAQSNPGQIMPTPAHNPISGAHGRPGG